MLQQEVIAFLEKQSFSLPTTSKEVLKQAKEYKQINDDYEEIKKKYHDLKKALKNNPTGAEIEVSDVTSSDDSDEDSDSNESEAA